ncbi:MAG: hypothetical protein NZM25_04380 [Leptospiraceae bacterium]|nr:hypothetical protein [Leptospiraceae bacterium]MDW8305749.1 hypothetical protein [Leptospiraceae bacterium]
MKKICHSFLIWISIFIAFTTPLFAEHGPLSTAGGVPTLLLQDLKPGRLRAASSITFTHYNSFAENDLPRLLSENPQNHLVLLDQALLWQNEIGWAVMEILSLHFWLPYYRALELKEAFYDSGGNLRLLRTASLSGVGDPSFMLRILMPSWDALRIRIQTGLKLPLGKTSSRKEAKPLAEFLSARVSHSPHLHVVQDSPSANPLGDLYQRDPSVMPGSGSLDFLFGYLISYTLARQEMWVEALFYRRGVYEDYQLGHLLQSRIIYRHLLTPETPLYAQVGLSYLWRAAHRFRAEPFANSGGETWFVLWGVCFSITGISLSLEHELVAFQEIPRAQQGLLGKTYLSLAYVF